MSKLLDNEFAQTPEEKMRAALDRDASELRKWLLYTALSSALLISVFVLLTSPLINTSSWEYIILVYLFSIGIFPLCFYLTARFVHLSILAPKVYLKFLPPVSFVYQKIEFALAGLMKISLTCIIATGLGGHLFFESGFCGPYLSILLTAALYGLLYSITVSSEYFNPMHEECIKLSQKEDFDYDFD